MDQLYIFVFVESDRLYTDRKSRTEQSPFAIKDVLMNNSANNNECNNLIKKDKTACEISLTLFYILENTSARKQNVNIKLSYSICW